MSREPAGPTMRWSLIGALALILSGCSFFSPSAKHSVTEVSLNEAASAASMISAYRLAHGMPAVTVDGRLNRAAEHQARAVARAGELSHGDFMGRMNGYGIAGNAAENLSAGSANVAEVVNGWKASAGHNANLLMPEARRIGLARADSDGGYRRYWALVLSQ